MSPNLSQHLIEEFDRVGLDIREAIQIIELGLTEDVTNLGDVTSQSIFDENQIATAQYRNRKPGVVAGILLVALTLELVGECNYEIKVKDGEKMDSDTLLIEVTGKVRNLLRAERVSLNLISHLSGIATFTNNFVEKIAGYNTKIRDTRKTTPGYRQLEKYAVRMGGGTNHRLNLSESALIKDNHIESAGSITKAFQKVKEKYPNLPIEIEVDNLAELKEAIDCKPDLIMLDNFSVDSCKQAVELINNEIPLEASGGITIENLLDYANTKVNFLAIGAITHSAPILDIGVDFKESGR